MLGELAIILSALVCAIKNLLQKNILRSVNAFSIAKILALWQLLFSLPLLFFVSWPGIWLLYATFAMAAFACIAAICGLRSIKLEEVSKVTPYRQFAAIFASLFGVVFLNEVSSITALVGIFLMCAGGILLAVEKNNKSKGSMLAVFLALFSAFCISLIELTNKALMLAGITFLPLLIFRKIFSGIFFSFSSARICLPKPILLGTFVLALLAFFEYGLFLFGLQHLYLSKATPLRALMPLFVLLLSKKFLLEAEKFWHRLFGTAFVVVGFALL